MIYLKFILLLTFGQLAFSKSCPTFYCKDFYFFNASFVNEEIEYEQNKIVIDEMEKESEYFKVGLYKEIIKNSYFSIEQSLIYNGKYEEFHRNRFENKNNRKYSITSFHEPKISLSHWFEHEMRMNYYHSAYISYTPKLYRPKIIEFGNGRHQVRIGYNFLNQYKKYWIEGDIYTEVFGRKKLILSENTLEITPAYTEFGVNMKFGYFTDSFRTFFQFGFGQTTNYSSKSKYITRESDKGFVTNLGFGVNLKVDELWSIDFYGQSITKVFNSIEEDHSQEIDFEFESIRLDLSLMRNF